MYNPWLGELGALAQYRNVYRSQSEALQRGWKQTNEQSYLALAPEKSRVRLSVGPSVRPSGGGVGGGGGGAPKNTFWEIKNRTKNTKKGVFTVCLAESRLTGFR